MTKDEAKIKLEIDTMGLIYRWERDQFESSRGYLTKIALFQDASGVPILCVREHATGALAKRLRKDDGIAYIDHALYVYLEDEEADYLNKAAMKDVKDWLKDYEVFFGHVCERCWKEVESMLDRRLYGIAIYAADVKNPNILMAWIRMTPPANIMPCLGNIYKIFSYTSDNARRKWRKAHPI